MPISATFQADFTAFTTAVTVAQTKLVSFEGDANKVAKSLSAMEKSISGVPIMQAATVAAEAVERLGGVTKLTYAELQRLGGTAQEAVDKMKALGQAVPTSIQNLADRARGASEDMLRLGESTKRVAEGGGALQGVLGGLAGQLAGMFTVGAVVAFGKEVLEVGSQVKKMAEQTGLTTDQVQRLNYVAGQSGTAMGAIITAVQNLQVQLGDESTGVGAAVQRLGINLEELKKQTAYEQLITIASAIKDIKDPTEQASKAADIFGKTWKEILPAVKSGMADVAKQAPVMADQTIQSLDRVGAALARAKAESISWGGAFVLAIEQAGFNLGDFLSKFDPEHFGVANSMLLEMAGHLNDPDGVRGALAKIPPVALDVVGAFTGVKMSAEDIKRVEADLEAQLKTSMESEAKLAADREKAEKQYADLLKEVAKIEKDTRGERESGLLGLDKVEQQTSQASMQAWLKANAAIEKSSAELRDMQQRATLSTTDYQIAKVNEWAAAEIKAFTGTEAQVAEHTATILGIAKGKIDAITAAATGALDVIATKATTVLGLVDLAARQAQAGLAVDVVGNAQAVGAPRTGMSSPIYVAPPIFARAAGGPVTSGQPYLVGERGPELFVPSTSGGIVPNGRAGVVQNITIHVNGTAADVARQVSDEIMRAAMRGQQFGAS